MDNKIVINVDTTSKDFMFNLGRLFAQGKRIEIENMCQVNENVKKEQTLGYSKSFNMMIKYWADNNMRFMFHGNLINKNKIFLICPVRNATEKEKDKLNRIIKHYENKGFIVHYPERDTNQSPYVRGENTGGFNICFENALAIANSKTIAIYYNKESTGSMFDLGVAYQMIKANPERKFVLLNRFKYDSNNPIDNKILELLNKGKQK